MTPSTCNDVLRKVPAVNVRSIFLSDMHLGTRGCQAAMLLDFLNQCDADQIYLIGDIIDGWRLKARWYWPESHSEVMNCLLAKIRDGAKVFYIPGNHDEFANDWPVLENVGFRVASRCIHRGANGKSFLIVHGDEFDVISTRARWLALLGDYGYQFILSMNRVINRWRQRAGLPYRAYSAWIKLKIKMAVRFISDFESELIRETERLGLDGVICGHIHHAALHDADGFFYINTGDWVESCTAVVENLDGAFEIIRWAESEETYEREPKRRRWATLTGLLAPTVNLLRLSAVVFLALFSRLMLLAVYKLKGE